MPVTPQPLPIQFSGGVETKTDAKQVPTTRLLACENVTFIKGTTLAKRNGYAAISKMTDDGTEYGLGKGLAVRDDELLLFDGARCWSQRPSSGTWADAGELSAATASCRPIARTGTAQTMVDMATNRGVTAVAWEDSRGGVRCSVLEAETGRVLLADQLLDSNGIAPRCCAAGSVLHIYHVVAATGRIYVTIVNPADPDAALTPAILTEDLSRTNLAYDAVSARGTTYAAIGPVAIAWSVESGGHRVGYVHPSGVLGSPVNGLPSVGAFALSTTDTITGPVAVAYDRITEQHLAVMWGDNSNKIWARLVVLTNPASETFVGEVSAVYTDLWLRVTCEFGGTDPSLPNYPILWWAAENLHGFAQEDRHAVEIGAIDSDGVRVDSDRKLLGHGLASRAWNDNGEIYAIIGHGPQLYTVAHAVRISGDTFGAVTPSHARLLPGSYSMIRRILPSVEPVDPGDSRRHAVALGYRIQLSSSSGTQYSEIGAMRCVLDFDPASPFRTTQLGRGLYLAAASPQHYDGRRWAEQGFHVAPDAAAGVSWLAQGGAGALDAGTYGYRVIYEEIDAQGELHQSAPSAEQNITVSANKKVTVTIPTLRLTARMRVRIGVFRSEQGATGDPDSIEFFRVTSTDPTATGDNGYLVNDPTVDTVTFTDNLTDAVLVTREPLYTNGGVEPNTPLQLAGGAIVSGKSRLFATDPINPQLVRYSQQLAEDAACEWPIQLAQAVDPYGGPVVALGIVDDTVVVFCETAIYGFGGPGPQANPNADSQTFAFSPSRLITSDVGCKAPGSVCQSPLGIVFQSSKGIKLLDRTLQVQDIGSAVYAYNAQTVTRATLLPDRHQVVFLTASGSTLLWDYQREQWSTFSNHEGIDAVVRDGVYHYLRSDGRVFRETIGQYSDDGSHIPMRLETAWIKLAGYLQGWQRILWAYFLGAYKSPHRLVVRYRIDYNEAWSSENIMLVDANYAPDLYGAGAYGSGAWGGSGGDTTRYQRGIHINERCQSIQFRIEDREDTSVYGACYELSELLVIGGVLGPAYKLPAARRS